MSRGAVVSHCLAIKGQDLVCIPRMGPSTEENCICGKVAWNLATGHGDPVALTTHLPTSLVVFSCASAQRFPFWRTP